MPDVATPSPRSTIWKKILIIGILGPLGIGAILFVFLTGYYFWQIKTGKLEQLSERFSSSISFDASLASQAAQSIQKDVTPFLQPYNQRLGESSAKITIVAFQDFECPFSQAEYTVLKEIMQRYAGAVQVVFKHFPISTIHPNAEKAGLAVECAGEQNKFWEYTDLLFTKKLFDEASLTLMAQALQLDITQFNTCVAERRYADRLFQDYADGATLGVRGTPTFFINNKKVEGVLTKKIWDTLLINELQSL